MPSPSSPESGEFAALKPSVSGVAGRLRQPRLPTSPAALCLLFLIALVLQSLDLISALNVIKMGGIGMELNPLIRAVWLGLGPFGVEALKLGLASAALGLLLVVGLQGRTRLARNCLVLASNIAAVGVLSNGGLHGLQ